MVEHFLDLRYARTDAFWEDTRLLDVSGLVSRQMMRQADAVYVQYACEDTKPLAGETADTGASYRRFKSWVVNAAQKVFANALRFVRLLRLTSLAFRTKT